MFGCRRRKGWPALFGARVLDTVDRVGPECLKAGTFAGFVLCGIDLGRGRISEDRRSRSAAAQQRNPGEITTWNVSHRERGNLVKVGVEALVECDTRKVPGIGGGLPGGS